VYHGYHHFQELVKPAKVRHLHRRLEDRSCVSCDFYPLCIPMPALRIHEVDVTNRQYVELQNRLLRCRSFRYPAHDRSLDMHSRGRHPETKGPGRRHSLPGRFGWLSVLSGPTRRNRRRSRMSDPTTCTTCYSVYTVQRLGG
jgi:hypothetical protein